MRRRPRSLRKRRLSHDEMTNGDEADRAIKDLNNYNLNGRSIVVNEARPRAGGGGGGVGDSRRR